MRIAINGAGIAGPTLAYWLSKADHDVLLVEQSPQLRSGGYIIDFWGVGYDIAEKMGILARVRELGYQVKEVRFVDTDGQKVGGFDVDVFNRATNDRFTSVRPRCDNLRSARWKRRNSLWRLHRRNPRGT
jgi:2-polyprenyl-6-methoxyphenol hydroxylase-like FAD-dependent oxidoreductase